MGTGATQNRRAQRIGGVNILTPELKASAKRVLDACEKIDGAEADHRGGPVARQRHQLHDDLGDDAESALGADEQLHQPVAGRPLAEPAAHAGHGLVEAGRVEPIRQSSALSLTGDPRARIRQLL